MTKKVNWRAAEHSSELTEHMKNVSRTIAKGDELLPLARNKFIVHVVELSISLGWDKALLEALQKSVGETSLPPRIEPLKETVVAAPNATPSPQKSGIFGRPS